MNNQKSQQTTVEKAKAKAEFRTHVINYVIVNTILTIINLTLTPDYIWFKWPLLGWGIGIVLHAIKVINSKRLSIKYE